MIVFCVYHDLMTNARSQEIIRTCQKIDDTVVVSYTYPPFNARVNISGRGKRSYYNFYWKAIQTIKLEKPKYIFLHDDYCSPILRWIVNNNIQSKVIYDSSELYINEEKNLGYRIKSWIFTHNEKKYLRYADVVIAANYERAMIMKGYFHLKRRPVIFDNVHKIEDAYNFENCEQHYRKYFSEMKNIVIYGGGVSEKRATYELSKAVSVLGSSYFLIIVGVASQSERNRFKDFLKNNQISNVVYVGFVSRAEFRYLLERAHINVSIFTETNLNQIFCASGKMYEGLFENCVLLASENPPFKRICDDFKIGVSTSNYIEGIKEICQNYDFYLNNVKKFCKEVLLKDRLGELVANLRKELEPLNDAGV